MSTSPVPDKLPHRLGDFEIAGLLGQGGSGVVYDARWGHREVALKVLHPSLVATDKEREQFLTEARRLAEIAHPGVVKVLSVGELGGRPYLAMEKLDGETLAARLGRGAIPAEIALRLFAQLVDAVAALHERELVHRNLKPENIVLVAGPQGEHAVILDFGIAKSLAEPASTTTSDGGVRGTPAYMAPERFFGAPASVATDVYELAVVLFAMLAGRLPWDDCGNPEVRLNPLRLADAAPGTPAALDLEVARALSTRGANRPPSARAFAEAVRVASGGALPAPRSTAVLEPQPTPQPAPAWFKRSDDLAIAPTISARPQRRRRWPWIGAALVVLAGAGATIAVVVSRRGVATKVVNDPWDRPTASSETPTTPTETPAPAPAHDEAPAPPQKIVPPRSDRPLRQELSASLGHFPHDDQAVIGVVVDELRQDPDLALMIFADARAKQIGALLEVEGCGVDFARTTDWASIGLAPGTKSVDVIISGRWTRDAIEACLGGVRHAEIQHLDEHGAEIARLHGGGGDRWFGWIDDHTFFLSTREHTDAAWIAARVRATDGPGGIVGELAPTLDRDAAAWAIADAAALADNELLEIPPGHVTARGVLGDGVQIKVAIRYADAAAAHHAHELIDQKLDAAAPGGRELGVFKTSDHDDTVELEVALARSLLHMVATSDHK